MVKSKIYEIPWSDLIPILIWLFHIWVLFYWAFINKYDMYCRIGSFPEKAARAGPVLFIFVNLIASPFNNNNWKIQCCYPNLYPNLDKCFNHFVRKTFFFFEWKTLLYQCSLSYDLYDFHDSFITKIWWTVNFIIYNIGVRKY